MILWMYRSIGVDVSLPVGTLSRDINARYWIKVYRLFVGRLQQQRAFTRSGGLYNHQSISAGRTRFQGERGSSYRSKSAGNDIGTRDRHVTADSDSFERQINWNHGHIEWGRFLREKKTGIFYGPIIDPTVTREEMPATPMRDLKHTGN